MNLYFLIKKYLFFFFFLPIFLLAKDTSFVIIYPAYNAEKTIKKFLFSILQQTYKNYRVIFIDNGSSDKTYEIGKNFSSSYPSFPISFKRFEKRKEILERIYEEVSLLSDKEIVLFFDSNSFFASKESLKKINSYFSSSDLWLIYGDPLIYSSNLCKNGKRWHPCRYKAFYPSIFQHIPLEDFFFHKNFFEEEFDASYMFPLLDLSKNHTAFLNNIVLSFKEKKRNEICWKDKFKKEKKIKKYRPLAPLRKLPSMEKKIGKTVDLIIFSYNRPLQLYALLESIQHIKGLNHISVLYRSSSKSFLFSYLDVAKHFPQISFIKQGTNPKEDFQPLLLQTAFSPTSNSPYIMFAVDDMIVKEPIDLYYCTEAMKKTKAHLFSLRLGSNTIYCYMWSYYQGLPHTISLKKNILAWNIDSAKGDFSYSTSVDMTIYRKKDLKKLFQKISFSTPNELEFAWSKYKKPFSSYHKKIVGLSFLNSKALNIPLNLVNPSQNKNMKLFSPVFLLKKYEDGWKIDISQFDQIKNISAHVEYEPSFIKK